MSLGVEPKGIPNIMDGIEAGAFVKGDPFEVILRRKDFAKYPDTSGENHVRVPFDRPAKLLHGSDILAGIPFTFKLSTRVMNCKAAPDKELNPGTIIQGIRFVVSYEANVGYKCEILFRTYKGQ